MANRYQVGELIRVTGTFTDPNASDDPIDPTAVKLYVKTPGDAITEKVYGTDTDLIKSTTGVYYYDISVTASGRWYWRFVGTGAAQAAAEYFFDVDKLVVST